MNARLTQPLDAEESKIADELARLSDATPPPALDSRIRAEAHAAVRRRPLRRWGGALAAVLALGVGIRMSMSPVPLPPGMMPSDSAVSEQSTSTPMRVDQAPRWQAESLDQAKPALAPKQSPAESAAAEPSEARARIQVESTDRAERLANQSGAQTPTAALSAPKSEESVNAAAPASAAAEAFPSPVLRKSKETNHAPATRTDMSPAPPPSSPAAAPASVAPTAPPLEDQSHTRSKQKASDADVTRQARGMTADVGSSKHVRDSQADEIVTLEALIAQARQLQINGETRRLQQTLRLIARHYPGAQLPDDVQAMLDAELGPR